MKEKRRRGSGCSFFSHFLIFWRKI